MKRGLYIALAIAAMISLGMGIFAGYAGLQHNPMGEFCIEGTESNCVIDLPYLLLLVLSWFLTTFLGLIAVIIPIWLICCIVIKKKWLKQKT